MSVFNTFQKSMMGLAIGFLMASCSSSSDSPAVKLTDKPQPPTPSLVQDEVDVDEAIGYVEYYCKIDKSVSFSQDWPAAESCEPAAYPADVNNQMLALRSIKAALEEYLNTTNVSYSIEREIIGVNKYIDKSLVDLEDFRVKAERDFVAHEEEIKAADERVYQQLVVLSHNQCKVSKWSVSCDVPSTVAVEQMSVLREKHKLLRNAIVASRDYLHIFSSFSTKNYEVYKLEEELLRDLQEERIKVERAMSHSYDDEIEQKSEVLEKETKDLFAADYDFRIDLPPELHLFINDKELTEAQLDTVLQYFDGEVQRIKAFTAAIQEVKELLPTKMLDHVEVGNFSQFEKYDASAYNYRETAEKFLVKVRSTATQEEIVSFFKNLDSADEKKNPLLKERSQKISELNALEAAVAAAGTRTEMPVQVVFPKDELTLDTFLGTYSYLNKYANEEVPEQVKLWEDAYGKDLFQGGYKIIMTVKLFMDVIPTQNSDTDKDKSTFELSVQTGGESGNASFTFASIRTREWIMAVANDLAK